MVRCPGSTRWSKDKPPRDDTVLLLMGRSPDSHFKSTDRCIPARLKSLFVIVDTESSVTGLLALVQTLASGGIHRTASTGIVKERHQPAMQPLHDGSYCQEHIFGARTTYIVPISPIDGAVCYGSTLIPIINPTFIRLNTATYPKPYSSSLPRLNLLS